MGRDGFQLAEPLRLERAPGPSSTGCGNIPLTTNWVLGQEQAAADWARAQIEEACDGSCGSSLDCDNPWLFLVTCGGGDGSADNPGSQLCAVRCNVVRRKYLAWVGSPWGLCVCAFPQHRRTWPFPFRSLGWVPWQETSADVTVYHSLLWYLRHLLLWPFPCSYWVLSRVNWSRRSKIGQ